MIERTQESASKHAPEYRGGEWWCHGKPMWRPVSQTMTRICNVRVGACSSFGIWTLHELRKILHDECDGK